LKAEYLHAIVGDLFESRVGYLFLICCGVYYMIGWYLYSGFTFRITTCRFLFAIVFRTWGLVCINLSFASREFVCARSIAFAHISIRIACGFVHWRGHHAFRESSGVSLVHGPRWLFLLSRHRKAFLLLLIKSLL